MATAPNPAPKPGPGWMQSSYWITLVGVVVTALVVTGLIPASESATVTTLVTDLLTKAMVLVGALVPFWQYLHSRLKPAEPRPSPDANPTPAPKPDVPVDVPVITTPDDFRV